MDDSPEYPRTRFTAGRVVFVVFAVVILLGIFLPWLSISRERQRREVCAKNLLGLVDAMQNHYDVYKQLPPGLTGTDTNEYGWLVYALPFLDQSELSKELWNGIRNEKAERPVPSMGSSGVVRDNNNQKYKTSETALQVARNIRDETKQIIVQQRFTWLLCPSNVLPDADNDGYGASHYCGNAGTAFDDFDCGAFPGNKQNGMLVFSNEDSFIHGVKLGDATDGTSNTIMLGEVSQSENVSRTRTDLACFPIWAGGNNEGGCSAWNMGSCLRIGDKEFPMNLRRGKESNLCFGSSHGGGAQFGMADGSMRSLAQTTDLEVYHRLCNRRDGRGVRFDPVTHVPSLPR